MLNLFPESIDAVLDTNTYRSDKDMLDLYKYPGIITLWSSCLHFVLLSRLIMVQQKKKGYTFEYCLKEILQLVRILSRSGGHP